MLSLLTVVAFATIIGGLLLTQQVASTTGTTYDNTAITAVNDNYYGFPGGNNSEIGFEPMFGGGPMHGPGGRGGRPGGYGAIEVSEEFQQNVQNIAENDTDVQNLLAEGYNVTSVKPMISTTIDAEGYVTTRATTAVLRLQKDTSGIAYVTVSIEDAKVTQIVILTRTVIEKT